MTVTTAPRVTVEQRGHVLLMGLNRPEKRNAADMQMLGELARAYGELERTADLRAGLVFAHGENFTAGLDLGDVAPRITDSGLDFLPTDGINPWQVSGPVLSKPVVVAVHGICLTLGIELILAADITVAAESTQFSQLEVSRGILPFGGATIRFPQIAGWGNAMRWMLTGDRFDAAEAYRIGLVQEVVPAGQEFDRALELANTIARQAPLAVQATLANARKALTEGDETAKADLQPALVALMNTKDARIGMESFLTRSPAQFRGE